jgi:hypothetical protein
MIVNHREFNNLVCFLILKKNLTKMVILVFKGSKGGNLEAFLIEYKITYIGTKLKTNVEWFNFLLNFLEVQHHIGLRDKYKLLRDHKMT